MKAIVINKFGEAAEVFENENRAVPVPNEEEILVKVVSTSVNPIDIYLRKGNIPALIPSFPAVLHGDVSGIVEAAGANVKNFRQGDAVFGWSGGLAGSDGALAEYMLVNHRLLAKKPVNLDFGNAAAISLIGLTAYEAIFLRANVQPGQTVLVYGGVGGVGQMGVQFAKLAGAVVYATVSNDEQAVQAKNLGADYVINYKNETVEDFVQKYTNGAGFDVVFDTVGNENLVNSFKAVKTMGTVVTTIAMIQTDLSPVHLKALHFHVVFLVITIASRHNELMEKFGEQLIRIAEWVEKGLVKVLTDDHQFSFEEVAKAHEYAEAGKNKGKIVITR